MEEGSACKIPDGCVNSAATLMGCRSFSNQLDEYEPLMSCDHLGSGEGSSTLSRSSAANSPETVLATSDKNNSNELLNQNSSADDHAFDIFVDKHVVPMLDKLPDGWNSDIAENCVNGIEAQLSTEDETSLECSESGLFSDSGTNGTVCHNLTVDYCDLSSGASAHYLTNDVIDSDINSERVQCSTQACSSSEFHPSVSEKIGRLARKNSGKSRGANKFLSASITGRSVAISNHSVWQEVRRTDIDRVYGFNDEKGVASQVDGKYSEAQSRNDALARREKKSRKPSQLLGSDEKVTRADSTKESSNIVNASVLLSKSVDGKITGGVKRKPLSGSKRGNLYTRKISHTAKLSMARPPKGHIQQKETSELLPLAHINNISSSSSTEIQKLLEPIKKNKFKHSETWKTIHLEQAKAPVSKVCEVGSVAANNQMSDLDADNQMCSLPMESYSSDQTLHGVDSHSSNARINGYKHEAYCDLTDNKEKRCINMKTVSPHGEPSKSDTNHGSTLQKWVPVGRKSPLVIKAKKMNSSVMDNNILYDTSNMNTAEVEVPCPNCELPMTYIELDLSNSSSQDAIYSLPEAEVLSDRYSCQPDKRQDIVLADDNLTFEVQSTCSSGLNDDLDIIVKAVNNAYQLQTASETFQSVTGDSVAELERFLHFASPILSQIGSITKCIACPGDQLTGDALCQHQIPSMSLGSLWRWYEKPGCYGLEVKLEGNGDSKKSRFDYHNYIAYFVPYLSAVQLFGCSRGSSCLKDGYSSRELMQPCEVKKASNFPSSLGSLPIFSKLLPQPHREVPIFSKLLPQPHREADTCSLKFSSSAEDEFCDRSNGNLELANEELLFEYFESAEPHQRRPLFEKIKALVMCEASSIGQSFGDPLNLECLNLRNLHPASWYSVAWYPIYRIPDGHFRAAFLTYHALGHFAYRRPSSNRHGGITSIVSPVVGLQNYNAKDECWFQPKASKTHMIQTGDAPSLNPLKLHRERLEALERTASLMARASVQKGNLRSVNRQPDYEFFLSRRR